MGKLINFAIKANLMNITIKYGEEKFNFNLYEETKINQDKITKEAIDQPSSYAFLALLQKRLDKKIADIETSCKRRYAEVYTNLKRVINEDTGRPNADEYCKEKTLLDPQYQELEDKLNKVRGDLGIIEACVKTFEQRQFLIQTISANTRSLNK